jgi:hypothetical protein
VLAAAALIAGVSLLTFGVLLHAARELQRLALTMESEARGHPLTRSEGCLRAALAAGGGVSRDDIAVLVAQVGLATMANRDRVASTAGRTAAGESSTRGQ